MVAFYQSRLATLQVSMLSELQRVKNGEEIKAKDAADMILEYESLVKTVQVCLNNSHRGLRVTWKKSTTADSNDSLEIEQNGEIAQSGNDTTVEDLEFLLRCIDWLSEYRRSFSAAAKISRRAAAEQEYIKRGESIEANAVQFDSRETPREAPQGSTTKDKLLHRTKQVSANLIRGNQVLQSAVLQSDLNLDELREQSHSLSQVNDKYMQLETVFVKTSQLVKTLEKASHQEKRDVYLALGFMSLCVAWVLWRRIFKIPTKLFLWLVFRFFKGILMTIGLAKRVPIGPHKVLAPPVAFLETTVTGTTPTTTIDSIVQAVDDAMSRILTHDEL